MLSFNITVLLALVSSIMLEQIAAFSLMCGNQPNEIDPTSNYSSAIPRRQCLFSLVIVTSIMQSQTARANDANLSYQGVYTDSKHTKGYRVLIGDAAKATLQIQNEQSDEVYIVPVTIGSTEGTMRFTFDYSSANKSSEVGTLTKDKEGINLITFPSGSWKKRETGPIGVYYDSSNKKKRVVIRQLRGSEWKVEIFDGDNTTEGRAKAGNPILFALPKGEVKGIFDMKEKTITFEDGSVWVKF